MLSSQMQLCTRSDQSIFYILSSSPSTLLHSHHFRQSIVIHANGYNTSLLVYLLSFSWDLSHSRSSIYTLVLKRTYTRQFVYSWYKIHVQKRKRKRVYWYYSLIWSLSTYLIWWKIHLFIYLEPKRKWWQINGRDKLIDDGKNVVRWRRIMFTFFFEEKKEKTKQNIYSKQNILIKVFLLSVILWAFFDIANNEMACLGIILVWFFNTM